MTLEVTNIGVQGVPGPTGPQGLAFHCAGVPDPNEVIGGGIAPTTLLLSAANSKCRALVAANAQIVLTIKNNGVAIGTITFAAASNNGVFAISAPTIVAGDQVTVHNASPADSALANIDGLLRG